jgi:hypothetical protein
VVKNFYGCGDQYVGEFKNDQPNGKGTMIYSDGNTYRGEFEDSIANGQGTMFCSDGSILIG